MGRVFLVHVWSALKRPSCNFKNSFFIRFLPLKNSKIYFFQGGLIFLLFITLILTQCKVKLAGFYYGNNWSLIICLLNQDFSYFDGHYPISRKVITILLFRNSKYNHVLKSFDISPCTNAMPGSVKKWKTIGKCKHLFATICLKLDVREERFQIHCKF